MKIALDINDVLRDYSNNFCRYYYEHYDHTYDMEDLEIWTNDMNILLPFKNDSSYERFTYETFVWELFGRCNTCSIQTSPELINWLDHTVTEIESEETIEVMIVSPMEYGKSLAATQYFISKLGAPVREFYFPKDSMTIWDRCDVLITANPRLLDNKPSGKMSIKIKTEYNKDCQADYTYKSFVDFAKDKNNTEKLLLNGNDWE